ncbi:MAG: WD40/YVTN/BNR-like repeat-containing protein [Armatimonadota bacterium]
MATYGPWRSCNIGGGGYIQDIVLCPSDAQRVYAYVDVGGVYRSDDGGRQWRMMNADLPLRPAAQNVRSLIVDPRDANRLLAATGDAWADPEGVYLSRDGGETWRRVLVAPFCANGAHRWAGPVLARDPRNPDLVLAASVGAGLWLSEDNGETWQQAGATGLYPTQLHFSRHSPGRAWLCAPEHKEWMRSQQAERFFEGGLHRSDDGGGTWQPVCAESPSEVLEDPLDRGLLFGLFGGVVKASRDGGASWQPFAEGLPARTTEIPRYPSGEGHPHPSDDNFQALAAGPDFVLTASTTGAFYRLQSGETRWAKVERQGLSQLYQGQPWYGGKGRFGMALASIVVDPRNPGHWFLTDWFAAYQTFDAGLSWQLMMDGVEVTCILALQQDPSDPKLVHLGMLDNGYFRSEDGGASFRNVRSGISNNVKCITLSLARPSRLYAVGASGERWESSQVFVSDDSGRSWRRSPMSGLPGGQQHRRNTIVASPGDPEAAYLAVSGPIAPGAGGVYVSEDGGESWRWMGEGLPEGEPFFVHGILGQSGREIAVGGDGTLVCIGQRGGVFRWPANAAKWERARNAPESAANCVVADPSSPRTFYLAAEGVYRSGDGGESWSKVLDEPSSQVAVDLAKPARVAAGAADGVMLSEDGGRRWRMLDQRLPRRSRNLVAFAGDHLVVGSTGSGAFWAELQTAE